MATLSLVASVAVIALVWAFCFFVFTMHCRRERREMAKEARGYSIAVMGLCLGFVRARAHFTPDQIADELEAMINTEKRKLNEL